jgi:thiosulfate/3-mercaptopyruvate sulfurtransferase
MQVVLSLPLALASASAPENTPKIFIDVAEARALIDRGAAVLDARGENAKAPFLPGAQVIDWKSTRDGGGRTGRLDDDLSSVKKKLEALGVSNGHPVLVYGGMSDGWGEEGRIWWVLRYLGHEDVHILDGGIGAWVKSGQKTEGQAAKPGSKEQGHFEPKPIAALRADFHDVDGARKSKNAFVIDSRSADEWNGATPYMEWRGGHVPGAHHVEWLSLIGKDGRLLPKDQVGARLKSLGIGDESKVITYCTGGVRSAFVQAVLLQYGYRNVANYDGSWFDWSRRSELPISLTPRISAEAQEK